MGWGSGSCQPPIARPRYCLEVFGPSLADSNLDQCAYDVSYHTMKEGICLHNRENQRPSFPDGTLDDASDGGAGFRHAVGPGRKVVHAD